jgi:hypothetical protein
MSGMLSLSGNTNKVKAADSAEEKQAESGDSKTNSSNKPVHDYIIKNFVAEEGACLLLMISCTHWLTTCDYSFLHQIRIICTTI